MRWVESLISWKNSKALQMTWFLLRAVRGSFPASQVRCVQTLSKDACTIVFWPVKQASPLRPQATVRMSTVSLSTWWYHLWKHSRMWDTPGNSGAEDGTTQMPSTSNSQERANTPGSKEDSLNSSHNPLQVGGKRS